MNKRKIGINLCGIELILGNVYLLGYGKWQKTVKLIQCTQYGYNFLNEEENRCILKQHLYVPVKKRNKYCNEKKFFIITEDLKNSISLKE